MVIDRIAESAIEPDEPGREFTRYWKEFEGHEPPQLRQVFGVGSHSHSARRIFENMARKRNVERTFDQPGRSADEARVAATLGGEILDSEVTNLLVASSEQKSALAQLDEAIRSQAHPGRRIMYMGDYRGHRPLEDARLIVRNNPQAFLAFLTGEMVVWSTVTRQSDPEVYLDHLDTLSQSIVMANVGAAEVDVVGSINTAISYLKELQAASEFPNVFSVAMAELDRSVPREIRFDPGFLRLMYLRTLKEGALLREEDLALGRVQVRGSIKTAGSIAVKALREDEELREEILNLGLAAGAASAEEVEVSDPKTILEVERARFAAKVFDKLIELAIKGDERLDGQRMIATVEKFRHLLTKENDIFRCRVIFATLEGLNLAMSRAAQVSAGYSEEVGRAMIQRLDAEKGLGAYVKMLVDTREGREREAKFLLEELKEKYHDLPDVGGWMARRIVEVPKGSVFLLAQAFLLGHLGEDKTFRILEEDETGKAPAALGTEIQMTTEFGEMVNQVHGPIYRNPFRTYRGAFGGADEAAGIVGESLKEAKRVAREMMLRERSETI